MRTLKITASLLNELGACPAGMRRFTKAFPRGVIVTDDQLANFDIVLNGYATALTCQCGGCGYGEDLRWLAMELWMDVDKYEDARNERRNNERDVGVDSDRDLFLWAGILAEAVAYLKNRKAARK